MKKILIVLMMGISTLAGAVHPNTNEKAVKYFNETFPKATNTKWADYPDYTRVTFEVDGMKNIVFNPEGELTSAQRYCFEKDLPVYITWQVKKKYKGMSIFGITEVTSANGIKYYLTLEIEKNWCQVESDGSGNLTLNDKFKKG